MSDAIVCQEFKKDLSKFYIIDVREADEYKKEHIKGAINFPLGRLIRDEKLGIIPRDKKIVVHCQSGLRGSIAQKFLADKGYDVKNLEGGYVAYKASEK